MVQRFRGHGDREAKVGSVRSKYTNPAVSKLVNSRSLPTAALNRTQRTPSEADSLTRRRMSVGGRLAFLLWKQTQLRFPWGVCAYVVERQCRGHVAVRRNARNI